MVTLSNQQSVEINYRSGQPEETDFFNLFSCTDWNQQYNLILVKIPEKDVLIGEYYQVK